MKRIFTLKQIVVLVALILCGLAGSVNAQVTLILPNASTANYSTIASAYAAINFTANPGANIIQLESGYVSSGETYPIIFTALTGASATNTVTVRPASGVSSLSISSSTTSQIFKFDGAKYVTIDGRAGGTGSSKILTITNTSTDAGASTITMVNDAVFNTLRYCFILGSSTSTTSNPTSGTIVIGSTTGTNARYGADPAYGGSGNLNNTIDNCDIADAGGNLPTVCIFMDGNATYTNESNTISNCNIYNYFNPGAFVSAGIYINQNTRTTTINANKFYQTATRTYTHITGSGVNYGTYSSGTATDTKAITNNIIGYSSNCQTGTMVLTGNKDFRFIGISNGRPLTTAYGNTIANIDITTSSAGAATVGTVCGIYTNNNFPSAIGYKPNVIKDIVVRQSTSTANAYTLAGIISSQSAALIENNQIYNLTVIPAADNVISKLYGIYVNCNNFNFKQNKIFNLTCGKSTSTAVHTVVGAAGYASGSTQTIERNLIYNLNAISSGASTITGLTGSSGTAQCTFQNNMIRLGTDVTSNAIIYGISQNLTGAALNLFYYNNTVYIGGSAPASATNSTYCFYSQNSTTTTNNTLQNNIFVNARTNVSGTTAKHYAIKFAAAGLVKPSTTGLNYNLYQASPLGAIATTDYANLAAWQYVVVATYSDAGSITGDPSFIAASADNPDLRIASAATSIVNAVSGATEKVSTDFFGNTRTGGTLTPTDLGAHAFALSYASPTVTLSSAVSSGSSTGLSPIPVTITFSASVTGFDASKLIVKNGLVSGFSGSGTTYTANILPSSNGSVTVDVLPGSGMNSAGYYNSASNQLSWTYTYAQSPTLAITTTASMPTDVTTIPVTITFNEAVTGFDETDVVVVNGNKSNFIAVSSTVYTVDVVSTVSSGNVTVDVAASAAINSLSNSNLLAANLTIPINFAAANKVTILSSGGALSANYASVKTAFDAINNGTHKGAIQIKINQSSTETATALLYPSGLGTSSYSAVSIYPTALGLTIDGAVTPLIDLNGASNVTIDGALSGSGSTRDLIISNTNTAATASQCIRLTNDASNNTIQNLIAQSICTATSNGAIQISGTSANGCDNNTITNCKSTLGSTKYVCGIYVADAQADNTSITYNEIDNLNNNGSTSNGVGIWISNAGNNTVVNYNKVYWSTAQVLISSSSIICLRIDKPATVQYNTIGGNSSTGSGTADLTNNWSGSAPGTSFSGIYVAATGATVSNNTIGNVQVKQNSATTTRSSGIYLTSTGAGLFSYNTITAITARQNNGTSSLLNIVNGIYNTATNSSAKIFSGNSIYGLTADGTGANGAVNIVNGIEQTTAASTSTYSGNTIYGLSAGVSTSTAANIVNGINLSTNTGNTVLVEKNKIYNLTTSNVASPTTGYNNGLVYGIQTVGGSTGTTIQNNMISLGNSFTIDATIYGIYQGTVTANTNVLKYYHNSVFIGGAPTASATKNTFAFYTAGATAITTGTNELKNNIFVNQRSVAGSEKHYAIGFATASVLTACDYNLYWSNLVGLATGATPADKTLVTDWAGAVVSGSDAHSIGNNPQFMDPTPALATTPPDLRIKMSATVVEAQGADLHTIVTSDFYGTDRSANTTPDLGAYEYTSTSPATSATDYFKSNATGNWGSNGTWQSSSDNSSWITATAFPSASAAGVTIQNGHLVTVATNATSSATTVNGGGKLSLNSGNTLLAASLALQSDVTNGTATFVDANATGGLTVTGTKTVEQYLTTGRNWYVSSPVASALSSVFSASVANPLYNYSETTGTSAPWTQITGTGTTLSVARGYIINMDATVLSNQSNKVTFTGGALNTGAITTGVNGVPALTRTAGQAKEGFNLVGNPYPSYLDWMAAIDVANTGTTNLMTTMWYRTQNPGTVDPLVPAYYVFDTYNETANTGTNNNGNGAVTQYIPPMQAFWVRVKPAANLSSTTGTLALTNAMRSHASGTNRLKVRSSASSSQPILRLQVSNRTNSDEAIVLFNSAASNGFDDFDSPKMSNGNNAIPEIYTLAGTEQVVINGLNSLTPNLELPLGFKTGTANSFSIKATEISNFDAATAIVLKDKDLMTEQELVPGVAYSFPSGVVNSATRFSLLFRAAGTTTKLENTATNSRAVVYCDANNHIALNYQGSVATGSMMEVYNLMGEKLVSKSITGTVTVVDNAFIPGVYLVTVRTAGKTTTQKVILN